MRSAVGEWSGAVERRVCVSRTFPAVSVLHCEGREDEPRAGDQQTRREKILHTKPRRIGGGELGLRIHTEEHQWQSTTAARA